MISLIFTLAFMANLSSSELMEEVQIAPLNADSVEVIPICPENPTEFSQILLCTGIGFSHTFQGIALTTNIQEPRPDFDPVVFSETYNNGTDYVTSAQIFSAITGFPLLETILPNMTAPEILCTTQWPQYYPSYNSCVADGASKIPHVKPTISPTESPAECAGDIYCHDFTAKALELHGKPPFIKTGSYYLTSSMQLAECPSSTQTVYEGDSVSCHQVEQGVAYQCQTKEFDNGWHCYNGEHQKCPYQCNSDCICSEPSRKTRVRRDVFSQVETVEKNFRIRSSLFASSVSCGPQSTRGNCASFSIISTREMVGRPVIESVAGETGICSDYICTLSDNGFSSCDTKCCIHPSTPPHFLTVGTAMCPVLEELNFNCMYSCSGLRCTLDTFIFAENVMTTVCSKTGSVVAYSFYVWGVVAAVILGLLVLIYTLYYSRVLRFCCTTPCMKLAPIFTFIPRLFRFSFAIIIGIPISVLASPLLLIIRADFCNTVFSSKLRLKKWYYVFIFFFLDLLPGTSAKSIVVEDPNLSWHVNYWRLLNSQTTAIFTSIFVLLFLITAIRLFVAWYDNRRNHRLNLPSYRFNLPNALLTMICIPPVVSSASNSTDIIPRSIFLELPIYVITIMGMMMTMILILYIVTRRYRKFPFMMLLLQAVRISECSIIPNTGYLEVSDFCSSPSDFSSYSPYNGTFYVDFRLADPRTSQSCISQCSSPKPCPISKILSGYRHPSSRGTSDQLTCCQEFISRLDASPLKNTYQILFDPIGECCQTSPLTQVMPSTMLSFDKSDYSSFARMYSSKPYTCEKVPLKWYTQSPSLAMLLESGLLVKDQYSEIVSAMQFSRPYDPNQIIRMAIPANPASSASCKVITSSAALLIYVVISVLWLCKVLTNDEWITSNAIISVVYALIFFVAIIAQPASASEPFFATKGLSYRCEDTECKALGSVRLSLDANRADSYSIILENPSSASQSLVLTLKVNPPTLRSEYQTIKVGYANVQTQVAQARRCYLDSGYHQTCTMVEQMLDKYVEGIPSSSYTRVVSPGYTSPGCAANGCFSCGNVMNCRGFIAFSTTPDTELLQHVSTVTSHHITASLVDLESYSSVMNPRQACIYNTRLYGSMSSLPWDCPPAQQYFDGSTGRACCRQTSSCIFLNDCQNCQYPFESLDSIPCPTSESVVTGTVTTLCEQVTEDPSTSFLYYFCPIATVLVNPKDIEAYRGGLKVLAGEADLVIGTLQALEVQAVTSLAVTKTCDVCPYTAPKGFVLTNEGTLENSGSSFNIKMAGTVALIPVEPTMAFRGKRSFKPPGGCDQFLFSTPGDYQSKYQTPIPPACWKWVSTGRASSNVEYQQSTTTDYLQSYDQLSKISSYPATFTVAGKSQTVAKNLYNLNRTTVYNGLLEVVLQLHNWTFTVNSAASELSNFVCHTVLYCQMCSPASRLSMFYTATCTGSYAQVKFNADFETLILCGTSKKTYLMHSFNVGTSISVISGSGNYSCPVTRIGPATEEDNPLGGDISVDSNDGSSPDLSGVMATWKIVLISIASIVGAALLVGLMAYCGMFSSCAPFFLACCAGCCATVICCKNGRTRESQSLLPTTMKRFRRTKKDRNL